MSSFAAFRPSCHSSPPSPNSPICRNLTLSHFMSDIDVRSIVEHGPHGPCTASMNIVKLRRATSSIAPRAVIVRGFWYLFCSTQSSDKDRTAFPQQTLSMAVAESISDLHNCRTDGERGAISWDTCFAGKAREIIAEICDVWPSVGQI